MLTRTIINYLRKLDFSETEAKLYIILLQKGSMSIADLAEKAKLNRTATYGYITRLLEKGVISKSKGASNKITANPPEQLHYLVDEKLSAANILQEQLFSVVTTLNTTFMRSTRVNESEMKYFKGRKGIRAIYDDCLKSNKICSYFNPKEIKALLPENTDMFEHSLTTNKQMEIFEIVEDSDYARTRSKAIFESPRHYWKFLPNDIKLTSNDILIYDDKVAIVNLIDEENFTGFILQNKDYYNNSIQLFELLWRLLPASTS
jgi:sugar-specific transcriptional regulator TrmB